MELKNISIDCPFCGKTLIPKEYRGKSISMQNIVCVSCKHKGLLGFDCDVNPQGDLIFVTVTASGINNQVQNFMGY
jgi:hypothetical protein